MTGYSWNGSSNELVVTRYNSDGTLDAGFGVGGVVTTDIGSGDDQSRGIALQSDGKIVCDRV